MVRPTLAVAVLTLGLLAAPATAAEPSRSLGSLIAAAAGRAGIHPDLLASIVWVESQAWPWALNVRGQPLYPRSRGEAEWALGLVDDRVDIGYAQISYQHWGRPLGYRKADLLDPETNLLLGAWILRHSMSQEAGWLGVGRYHSTTRWRKIPYAAQVARVYQALQRSRQGRAHAAPAQ